MIVWAKAVAMDWSGGPPSKRPELKKYGDWMETGT